MPAIRQLCFMTGSKPKYRELQHGLVASGVHLGSGPDALNLTMQTVDIPEIQGSIEDIARYKCSQAAKAINGPALTEDTALCFDAWNGLPGPYVKDFSQKIGCDNFHTLLNGFDNKSAEAVCTFAYSAGPDSDPILFQGRTKGKIVPARGSTDFAWDICFEYQGTTYSEMTPEEKTAVSHRGKAVAKLAEWIQSQRD